MVLVDTPFVKQFIFITTVQIKKSIKKRNKAY